MRWPLQVLREKRRKSLGDAAALTLERLNVDLQFPIHEHLLLGDVGAEEVDARSVSLHCKLSKRFATSYYHVERDQGGCQPSTSRVADSGGVDVLSKCSRLLRTPAWKIRFSCTPLRISFRSHVVLRTWIP